MGRGADRSRQREGGREDRTTGWRMEAADSILISGKLPRRSPARRPGLRGHRLALAVAAHFGGMDQRRGRQRSVMAGTESSDPQFVDFTGDWFKEALKH